MTLFVMASVLMVACLVFGGILLIAATRARPRTIERLDAFRPQVADEQAPERTSAVLDGVDRAIADTSIAQRLQVQLQSAAVNMTAAEALAVGVGGIVLGGALGFFVGGALLGLFAALIGGALPYAALRMKESRRKRAFDRALPDTLGAIASGLGAGHALPIAIQESAKYATGPMADELNRVVLEVRLSRSVEDALDASAARMDNTDLGTAVMALRIADETGGNLAEILKNVAATIRERERLRRHARTLSAEGRLSAAILGGLPVLVFFAFKFLNPDYIGTMTGTGLGIIMLIAAVVLLTVGVVWMRGLIKGVQAA